MTKNLGTPLRAEDSRESLRHQLQAVLGQLFDLHVQGVEAHAHFIGTRFTGMQRQLEYVVQTAREASDSVAELLRGLDRERTRGLLITEVPPAIPGLRPGERCTTAAANMVTHRISLVLNTIRGIVDELGDHTSTAGLLRAIAETIDREAMTLVAESRSISSTAYSVGTEK
jgi:starvation-inducible DNA-binding protein